MRQLRLAGAARRANMLTVHYAPKGGEGETARGGGAGIICVALMAGSSIPAALPEFSELLMFVISCITLEDSDWKNTAEIYMGQILTIAGSWVSEEKKRCKLC